MGHRVECDDKRLGVNESVGKRGVPCGRFTAVVFVDAYDHQSIYSVA